MDAYSKIEKLIADKYKRDTTTRKAVGDFMLTDTHAVNVKSNNVAKQNYSPNMISIQKMHKWVFEDRNDLSNAIAINSSMAMGAGLIGPAIAGLVIGAFGEGWCFLIDGVSYLAVIASLLLENAASNPETVPIKPSSGAPV